LVKHLAGNMKSRWTDFLTSNGEKEWRNRDAEFENDLENRKEITDLWESGWSLLFQTLDKLTQHDLSKTVVIGNQEHSVVDAINRQLAHYSYHVGQIVYISKSLAPAWKTLTIPRKKAV
jgi:hypothetical protein